MCGIAGYIDNQVNYEVQQISINMGQAIQARGPNSSGVWNDPELGVNLIHRRLAILDLSAAGHQPMLSASQRFVVVFNGEIYNFKLIRRELEQKFAVSWRGHSDTEVILLAFDSYGIEATLAKLEGMFAIALWDRQEQSLYLIRDRIGEKPLYYGYFKGVFAFASELKALLKHPKFNADIAQAAIGQLLLHNCIPAPLSIFAGIYKLMPGHYLKLSYSNYVDKVLPESKPYWELKNQLTNRYSGSLEQAILELDERLKSVIADQIIADVPVGCFLSGGVDSSIIAGIAQSLSTSPIKTFSIGFEDQKYNEAEYAKAVAQHLGTDHYELYLTGRDGLEVIQSLPSIYDEPFSDSSQLPTFLLAKLARSQVTVALSGDGGDELFCGYTRYFSSSKLQKVINLIPQRLKPFASQIVAKAAPFMFEAAAKWLNIKVSNIHDKVYKAEYLLQSKTFEEFYLALTSHWLNLNQVMLAPGSHGQSLWLRECNTSNISERMMYLDALGYLPDDILVKVDRAAMANSLETRVPLLNHKIVEFAFSLPLEYKVRNGQSKAILREVLYKYVPKALIERPKRGFSIPIQSWLREDLKDWACALLDKKKIAEQGYFNAALIDQKLQDHLSGKSNSAYQLWDVLMFQQWLEAYQLDRSSR